MTFLAAGLAGPALAGAALVSGISSSSVISSDVTPGLLGFLVVAGLGAALVFLLRSMNKQFRKLGPKPEDAEAVDAEAVGGPAHGTDAGTVAADPEAEAEQAKHR